MRFQISKWSFTCIKTRTFPITNGTKVVNIQFINKTVTEKYTFCAAKISYYAPSPPTGTEGFSEISIVVCVFGSKQSEWSILCCCVSRITKSNSRFYAKKTVTEEAVREGISVSGWQQLKGVQSEALMVWVSKMPDRHCSLATGSEKAGRADQMTLKSNKKHICSICKFFSPFKKGNFHVAELTVCGWNRLQSY